MSALFPCDPGGKNTEAGDTSFIYVSRFDASNREVTCPRVFTESELPDEAALFQLYGGGSYLLRARDKDKRKWTASRRLELPGPPKPLAPPPTPDNPVPLAVPPSPG